MQLPASLNCCSHTIPGRLRKHPLRDYAQRHYSAARSAFACEPCVARSSSAKAPEGATRPDLRSQLHKRPAEDGHDYKSDQVPLRYSVDASSLAVAEGLLIGPSGLSRRILSIVQPLPMSLHISIPSAAKVVPEDGIPTPDMTSIEMRPEPSSHSGI